VDPEAVIWHGEQMKLTLLLLCLTGLYGCAAPVSASILKARAAIHFIMDKMDRQTDVSNISPEMIHQFCLEITEDELSDVVHLGSFDGIGTEESTVPAGKNFFFIKYFDFANNVNLTVSFNKSGEDCIGSVSFSGM